MAASGFINGAFSKYGTGIAYPFISWSATQNAGNNTSTVTVNLYFKKVNSAYYFFNQSTHSNTANIAGATSYSANNAFNMPQGTTGDFHIRSFANTVAHDADGNCSLWIGWSGDTGAGVIGTYDFGGTIYLDPIIRACAVTTTGTVSVGGTSATVEGNVTDAGLPRANTRGFHWGTSAGSLPNWVASGSGAGVFRVNLTGLARGTTYYFRAGAYNTSYGWSHGSTLSFTTTAAAPSVTTGSVTNLDIYSATVGGNVTNANGATVTERGVCYNTGGSPTTSSSKVTSGSGTGAFNANISGLNPDTTYYARAYAINSQGTSYGAQISFKTKVGVPEVTTTAGATDVTISSATVAGSVVKSNGASVTERGFVYALTANPTTANSKATVSGTTGAMTRQITGLSTGITYHFRAYAINSVGVGYGTSEIFATLPYDPSNLVAATLSKTEIGLTWTKGVGGNYTIIRRGKIPPANINSGTLVYSSTGTSFTDTGLDPGEKYYYRIWSATTEDWSLSYSANYSSAQATTIADFEDPENALADDSNYAVVLTNNDELLCQTSFDGGVTWSSPRSLTFGLSVEGKSFGEGSEELWGMLTLKGGHVSNANLRVRLIGGSEGLSRQDFKNFGFTISNDYTLTGFEVEVKAAYVDGDILLYYVKANPYYGTSPLPIKEGSLAYDTTKKAPTFYDGTGWVSLVRDDL